MGKEKFNSKVYMKVNSNMSRDVSNVEDMLIGE